MTLKDCYMQMGADYEETVQRLRSESLIQRIILKFPQDPSYQELCQALADGNIEVAFRAAHTLKGVCQNLGFKNLYEPSAELTERLRPLQETETALTQYARELDRRAALRRARDEGATAARLARLRNEAGVDSLLNVLVAERQLASLEAQLAQSDAQVTTNQIALFKALGGGFHGAGHVPGQ